MAGYTITKSDFLEGWVIVSPAPCEGTTVGSHAEAVAWMDIHAWQRFETHYALHTAVEPAAN